MYICRHIYKYVYTPATTFLLRRVAKLYTVYDIYRKEREREKGKVIERERERETETERNVYTY